MVPSAPCETPRERFLHRPAMLFEPVVDAAGPGTVFETSSARFGHCPWATREGRAREGRGVGLGAGLGGGRLRCREGRVTVLIVPSRSSTSSSGGKPQAQHTRAAAHAAREGRGAGCGGGCCEGCVRCREGRLRPRERFLHKLFVPCARARSAARSAARRRAKFSSAARRGLQPGDEGARRQARARAGG